MVGAEEESSIRGGRSGVAKCSSHFSALTVSLHCSYPSQITLWSVRVWIAFQYFRNIAPTCELRLCLWGSSKSDCCWEWANPLEPVSVETNPKKSLSKSSALNSVQELERADGQLNILETERKCGGGRKMEIFCCSLTVAPGKSFHPEFLQCHILCKVSKPTFKIYF